MQVLIFGDNHERQANTCLRQFKSHKHTNWLYDNVFMQSDLPVSEVIEKIFAHQKFIPEAIVDNGHFIDKSKAKFSDQNWRRAIETLVETAYPKGQVNSYTCDR
jgi:hypothetical protein